MLRRSDFIAATYALSLVFANFGIAIAARMPMMTTTIRSSISVKPFLLLDIAILLKNSGYRRRLSQRPAELEQQPRWLPLPLRRQPLVHQAPFRRSLCVTE